MKVNEIETPRGLKSWVCSCGCSNKYRSCTYRYRQYCLTCKLYIDSKTEKFKRGKGYEDEKRAGENRESERKEV